MAADKPRPRRPEGPGSDGHDKTLWMLLCAVVAHRRPVLPAVLGVTDADPQRRTQSQIIATAQDVATFGDKVGELAAVQEAPDGPGSARAVAAVAVRMCQQFALCWLHEGQVTSTRKADFEREIDLLEAFLDAIAARWDARTE